MLHCFIVFLLTTFSSKTLAFVQKPLRCLVIGRCCQDQVGVGPCPLPAKPDPSLHEILTELDSRGIRYPPTASKSDLMNLLFISKNNSTISSTQQQLETKSEEIDSEKVLSSSFNTLAADSATLLSNQVAATSSVESQNEEDAHIISDPMSRSNETTTTTLVDSAHLKSAKKLSSSQAAVASEFSNHQNLTALSLSDLLDRLDALNVRYSPTDSRFVLEQLLSVYLRRESTTVNKSSTNNGKEYGSSSNNNSNNSNNKNSAGSDQRPIISLLKLIQRLDELGVRYPPTASRQELEKLLEYNESILNVDSTRREPSGFSSTQEFVSSKARPEGSLTALLQELDALGIRYSPTTTRKELEALLKKARWRNDRNGADQRNGRVQDSRDRAPHVSRRQRRQLENPVSALMDELEEMGIPIPPGATRIELEALLREKQETLDDNETISDAAKRQSRRRRRMQKQESQQSPFAKLLKKGQQTLLDSGVWETIPNKVGSKAVRTVDRAKRKARQVSRRATDFFVVDDDGVRDVSYKYVRRDPVTNVQPANESKDAFGVYFDESGERRHDAAERREKRANYSQKGRNDFSHQPDDSSMKKQESPRSHYSNRRRNRPADATPSDRVFIQRPAHFTSNLKRLPPVGGIDAADLAAEETPPRRRPQSREPSSSSRRIYSPYKDSFYSDQAAIDKLGRFVKDSADNIMWGDVSSLENGGPRHWKDKLEERFDSLLGIHEEGKEYRRWTEKLKADKREEGGFDALSVAQGREPKKYGTSRPRRSKAHSKPFWEEEGNIVSLLFGRTQSGQSLLFEKLLDQETGSLLNLFRAAFKSVLLVASYLCRWASVRGALPQPLVALGVITAGLSARPRHRIRAIVVALIVMRTCGELLHGYVYGDEGWEEDVDGEDEPMDENHGKLVEKSPDLI